MTEVKFFEIRDRATCIPTFAFRPRGEEETARKWLARRAGFNAGPGEQCVIFGRLEYGEAHYDPYSWGDSRTMREAHKYIIDHYDELEDGAVIDVRFILGETTKPAESDRFFTGM